MSLNPEIEIVTPAGDSLRYLEHGWPSDLCRWHAHEEYELHLIVRTHGRAFIGDWIGEFGPGSLYLTGPGLPHNWITDGHGHPSVEVRDMLVQFRREAIDGLAAGFPEFAALAPMLEAARSGVEFSGFSPARARAGLAAVRDGSRTGRIAAFLSLLSELAEHEPKRALSVVRRFPPARSGKQARIGRVVDRVVEDCACEMSLAQAASMAGMSGSAFSRNFRAVTGNRFTEFVNRVRIGRACSMLYATDEQVSAICHEVGFRNLANFNRRFLQMKGMTPSEYRETARQGLAREAPAEEVAAP